MKKTLLLSLFMGIFILSGQAQQHFFIGAHGSYNIYTIINQNNYGQKEMDTYLVQDGIFFGGEIGYKFNANHQVSIGYGQYEAGQDYKDNFNNSTYKKAVFLKYHSVPIIYRFTLGNEKRMYEGVKLIGEIGPQIGFLKEGKVTLQQGQVENDFLGFYTSNFNNPNKAELIALKNSTDVFDVKELYNGIDLMAHVGLGISTIFGESIELSVILRAGISIGDINKEAFMLPNDDGIYEASRNGYGGMQFKLCYLL